MRSLVESGTQPAATGKRPHHSPVMEPLRKPLVPFASARVETVLAAFAFPRRFYKNSSGNLENLHSRRWRYKVRLPRRQQQRPDLLEVTQLLRILEPLPRVFFWGRSFIRN